MKPEERKTNRRGNLSKRTEGTPWRHEDWIGHARSIIPLDFRPAVAHCVSDHMQKQQLQPFKTHVTLLTRETEILNKSRLMIPTRVRIDVRWMTALHVTNPLHINTHNNTLRELRESTVVMKALKRVNKYMRLKTSERLALFQLISALLVHELQEPQSSRNHGSDSRGGTRSDITHNIKRCVLQMTLFYKHTGIKIYRKYTQLKREDCKYHY